MYSHRGRAWRDRTILPPRFANQLVLQRAFATNAHHKGTKDTEAHKPFPISVGCPSEFCLSPWFLPTPQYQTFPVHSRWDQSALAQAYHTEMPDGYSRVLLF